MRYNRKAIYRGEKVDSAKETWPLPFEGDVSITSLLKGCGWTEDLILTLRHQLFDLKEHSLCLRVQGGRVVCDVVWCVVC